MDRHLAAILAADVVGYSRLMSEDEEGTLARLKVHQRELIDPTIARHNGRVVKLMGDGVLAELASAVDAVRCAVDIQDATSKRNANEPEDRLIQLRIGINLGDVIADGDDIYGDGVNMAARLESLAEPGGICISAKVYGEVAGRVDFDFEDLGRKKAKNVAGGMHVYRILPRRHPEGHGAEACSGPRRCLALDHIPSIAVLPFDNMSGDPEQEFFADGVSEEIITELCRYRDLFVVARNSSFSYKGRSVKVQDIGCDLGVTYVLEGSVRIAGGRLRVIAQLVETGSGAHVWGDRYDRDLRDVLTVQAEIAQIISSIIIPEVAQAEQKRARRRAPQDLNSWECYQRGLWHLYRFTHEDLMEARRAFEGAIQCDPEWAAAHSGLAYTLLQQVMYGDPADPAGPLRMALDAARKGVELDDHSSHARFVLGRALVMHGEVELARGEFETAIELNPSYSYPYFGLGIALLGVSEFEDALENFRVAQRLSPRDPHTWAFIHYQSWPMLALERYEEVVGLARQALRSPNAGFWPYIPLIAALGHLGREEEARKELERLLLVKPAYSCAQARRNLVHSGIPLADQVVDALRKAGLPEVCEAEPDKEPGRLGLTPMAPRTSPAPITASPAAERRGEAGLAWPDGYQDLKPRMQDEWEVEGQIYLHRQLSGKSGAMVYAVDITSRGFSGQAILKLDDQGDPAWSEQEESERHRRATEAAPEFAAKHLPSIVHTCRHDGRIAILSTIAARGLEYARPWARCPYHLALVCVDRLARELLEGWNRDYEFAVGMLRAADLLQGWLGYRLDPGQGRIHTFLEQTCGLSATAPSFILEGHWYPNPLAIAGTTEPLPDATQLRAAIGNIHGDLHGFNVLVQAEDPASPEYHLIDLALYRDRQFLFYDHAYFELSYLLRSRESVGIARFKEILDALAGPARTSSPAAPSGDDVGLIRLLDVLRRAEADWIERHEPNRIAYLTCQRLLARVAVGLNFVNKRMSAMGCLMALVYAAHNAKHYLKFQSIDWPREGQPLKLATGDL